MRVHSVFGAVGLAAAVGAFAVGGKDRAEPKAPAKPTYSDHVAEILNRKCVECHRPGEVAPFSLVGYANAKKWSGMIAKVTGDGLMPPWKAVHGYGEFRDENRLSDIELRTLQNWAKTGASLGNAKKVPKTPVFESEWTLGKPDLVLQPDEAYKLGAEGEDVYRNFVIKTDFREPVWVKAMDVRPGNKSVVHHVIAFLDRRGNGTRLEAANTDGQLGYTSSGGGVGFLPSGALGGWAPGVRAQRTEPGTAYRIEPGESIVMQVHYHKSGKPETDLTKLGLYLAKEPIEKPVDLHWQLNIGVNIPAGASDHKMRHQYVYQRDETIYTVMPHMHLLGKSMKSWLEFPDGTTRPLVYVDKWDFNWQLIYHFKEPIHVPKGTRQIIEAVYDNSEANPSNPNHPPKRVTWGEETTDEMFLLITSFTVDSDKK